MHNQFPSLIRKPIGAVKVMFPSESKLLIQLKDSRISMNSKQDKGKENHAQTHLSNIQI